jgi:hypothetical protein
MSQFNQAMQQLSVLLTTTGADGAMPGGIGDEAIAAASGCKLILLKYLFCD